MSNTVDHDVPVEAEQSAPDAFTPRDQAAPTKRKARSVSLGQVLAGILFILAVIIVAENTDDVAVRLVAGPKINAPVFVWLLGAAVVGGLIAWLMRLRRAHNAKIKAQAKEHRQELKAQAKAEKSRH